jgi:hypothetical protein
MAGQEEDWPGDLSSLVVPVAGALAETGDLWEPYYLSGPDGGRVEPVSEFLRDLQAAGRPATTQRSYSLALLRWFRFTWAVDVPWNQATRIEARVILSPQRTVFHVQQRHLSRCSLPGGHGYLSLHPARR